MKPRINIASDYPYKGQTTVYKLLAAVELVQIMAQEIANNGMDDSDVEPCEQLGISAWQLEREAEKLGKKIEKYPEIMMGIEGMG